MKAPARKAMWMGVPLGILLVSFFFNRAVLSTARRYAEAGMPEAAFRAARTAAPFDPLLYIGRPDYFDLLSRIRAAESVRRFSVFHPVRDKEGCVDTGYMDRYFFGEVRGYRFADVWKRYRRLIRLLGHGETDAREAYREFYAFLGIVCRKDPGPDVWERMRIFHRDYARRLKRMRALFGRVRDFMEDFLRCGGESSLWGVINVLRDFDMAFELRYPEEQPLRFVHSLLVRTTVLFQARAINVFLEKERRGELERFYREEMLPALVSLEVPPGDYSAVPASAGE